MTHVIVGGTMRLSSWFDLNLYGINLCNTRIGLHEVEKDDEVDKDYANKVDKDNEVD